MLRCQINRIAKGKLWTNEKRLNNSNEVRFVYSVTPRGYNKHLTEDLHGYKLWKVEIYFRPGHRFHLFDNFG